MSNIERLKELRVPFAEHHISYLPKGGVKLAYVGHAALTDRLLDVDPMWTWEPLAFGEDGLPQHDAYGGLWIKLTVCGVTRLGYGDAGDKKGPAAEKERIGDALRNAAMRFGAALDLWHKGDLHGPAEDQPEPPIEVKARGGLSDIGRNIDQERIDVLNAALEEITFFFNNQDIDSAWDAYNQFFDDERLYLQGKMPRECKKALMAHFKDISQQPKAA